MSLEQLSTEIKQIILGYLDLVSLLVIRNTNKNLRDIVDDSLSRSNVICPARAKLLYLYLDLHLYPSFRASRKHVLPHLKPFSRKQYLEQLQSQLSEGCPKARIPEEFAVWVMEWPENAVIGWTWPGLDEHFVSSVGIRKENENWWRTHGANMLCLTSDKDIQDRLCWALQDYQQPNNTNSELLGLFVHYHGCTFHTILCFDCDSARDGMVWAEGDISDMTEVAHWHEMNGFRSSWIEWLKCELKAIEHQYS